MSDFVDYSLPRLCSNVRAVSDLDKRRLSRLRSNDPSLSCVDLRRLDEARARDLADALRCNTRVTRLSLHWCDVGDRGAAALAHALRSNRSLTAVFLNHCGIGDAGAEDLAAALVESDALATLHLQGNRIGVAGAAAIANALSERNQGGNHAALSELNLGRNAIGRVGGRALAAMLRRNSTIRTLHLSSCGVDDAVAKALAAALVVNGTIVSLDLRGNRIGDVGAKALACANLLRLRYCLVHWDDKAKERKRLACTNTTVQQEGKRALDQSLRLCRNADVHANDVHEAVTLVEKLLPEIDFLSLLSHKARITTAPFPIPGRLAIMDRAHRFIIKHILEKTRPIPDAAMPLALQTIGGGGEGSDNHNDNSNGNGNGNGNNNGGGINIDALFVLCCDNPDLLLRTNAKRIPHQQGQAQRNASVNIVPVPAKLLDAARLERKHMCKDSTNSFVKRKKV